MLLFWLLFEVQGIISGYERPNKSPKNLTNLDASDQNPIVLRCIDA